MAGVQLHREISAVGLFTLAFGSIIGVGWITVLGSWLGGAGPAGAALALFVGGVFSVLVGLCYAEVGAMLPSAGGEVVYAREAFGSLVAFWTGWFLSLAYVAAAAFESISLGWIFAALLPGARGPVLYTLFGHGVTVSELVLNLAGTAFLLCVNYVGARAVSRFQNLAAYILIGVSGLFVVASFFLGAPGNLEPLFGADPLRATLAILITAPFWFGGFNVIPQALGERSANFDLRHTGRVLLITIAAVWVFYTFVAFAAAYAAPRQVLLRAELPAAEALSIALGSSVFGRAPILLAGLFGLMTAWNAVIFAGARVIFAMGEAKLITPKLASLHPRFGSPARAVVLVALTSAALAVLGRGVVLPLVNLVGFSFGLMYLVVSLAFLRFRRERPDAPRPYRVAAGRFVGVAAALSAIAIIFAALREYYVAASTGFPVEWTLLLLWTVIGMMFLVSRAWASRRAGAAQ